MVGCYGCGPGVAISRLVGSYCWANEVYCIVFKDLQCSGQGTGLIPDTVTSVTAFTIGY